MYIILILGLIIMSVILIFFGYLPLISILALMLYLTVTGLRIFILDDPYLTKTPKRKSKKLTELMDEINLEDL